MVLSGYLRPVGRGDSRHTVAGSSAATIPRTVAAAWAIVIKRFARVGAWTVGRRCWDGSASLGRLPRSQRRTVWEWCVDGGRIIHHDDPADGLSIGEGPITRRAEDRPRHGGRTVAKGFRRLDGLESENRARIVRHDNPPNGHWARTLTWAVHQPWLDGLRGAVDGRSGRFASRTHIGERDAHAWLLENFDPASQPIE